MAGLPECVKRKKSDVFSPIPQRPIIEENEFAIRTKYLSNYGTCLTESSMVECVSECLKRNLNDDSSRLRIFRNMENMNSQ